MDDFINGLTPGNYFLTKSMEITKINTSGTLWYLKKFLVCYDAVFLSKKVRSAGGIKDIIKIFDSYISSLPEEQHDAATKFFYPSEIDIRKNYRTWHDFAGVLDMKKYKNADDYYALVDRYYFVYLMNLGGQSKVKAYIREKLYGADFQVNQLEEVVAEYQKLHPEEKVNVNLAISDYHAALRNERQILFYFGFVHSRTNGAGTEHEFASLTPVGDLALVANAESFQLIWEHQKIKMISQPPTVEFPSIKNCTKCNKEKFKLNYSPYLSILRCLEAHGELGPRLYDRVLSRSNNENIDAIINNYALFNGNLNKVTKKIESFNVKSDLKNEDFEKEIKKYLLGLRADLKNDSGKNVFGCIIGGPNDAWKVSGKDILSKIVKVYSAVDGYKLKKYHELFVLAEEELRRKYDATAKGLAFSVNPQLKMRWDLYNIHTEKVIMVALMVASYTLHKNTDIEKIKMDDICKFARTEYGDILASIGLTNVKSIMDIFKDILTRLADGSMEKADYTESYNWGAIYVNKYTSLNSTDLFERIKKVSKDNLQPKLERKRDEKIISLVRKYNLIEFSDKKHFVACECCGNNTFLDKNNEPYLEYHHLIPFGIVDGPDHYLNIFGICPTCHRKIHFINDKYKESLYNGFDKNNHLKISIVNRLKELRKIGALKSYQLEYALTEQIINEDEYGIILAK